MMKKILLLITIGFGFLCFSQSKITIEQAEKSTDTKLIAAFVKENPTHPKVPMLKRRLVTIMNGDSPASNSARPTIKPMDKDKMSNAVKKDVADGSNDKNKKTAELLTHIFNSDPNRKEAYVRIINRSKCNLIVKISGGKKFYNLNVPALNDNYILIPKGSYTITTMVCDAKYSSIKKIEKDVEITLHSNK